ncbi:MAG TPA: signal recognition particle receptor subunit alpha, partial [Anaerolineales bacterium]|nr:signal recognition particle receptor subunit alpha [Anaerolineales bacterium]
MAEFLSRWRAGLSKTSKTAFGRLAGVLGATEIKQETWDELEALLIQADLGIGTTEDVIDSLRHHVQDQGLTRANELYSALRAELRSRLMDVPLMDWSARPTVILVVGV